MKNTTTQNFSPARRNILKAGASAAALFSVSGLTLFSPRAKAEALTYNLVAESYVKTMVDGVNVMTWRFRDLSGTGPGGLESGITAQAGDDITINITNNLTTSIKFDIPGVLENQAEQASGANTSYNFTAPAAGSYFIRDNKVDEFGQAMGLSAPMIIMPSDGSQSLYVGGPTFDRQYTLVINEFDDRLNSATANGQSYDLNQFEPNYYFVNGLSYPDTANDADTKVSMLLNEDVAIRFINTGLLTHSMHFHGYHVKVISRNRVPVTDIIDKDTVRVDPGECVDIILPVVQTGTFPLHTHYIPAVTANGVYVNPYGGALLILDAV